MLQYKGMNLLGIFVHRWKTNEGLQGIWLDILGRICKKRVGDVTS